jgi:putative nucleotidyltransferase with HDIG domain
MLGLSVETANAIRALDEHWNGKGQPYGTQGEQIPLLARILGLAQTVEVFYSTYGLDTALGIAAARRGSWFDPMMVDALFALQKDAAFWHRLEGERSLAELAQLEPADVAMASTDERLDRCAGAFARVIDAKSPWTFRHSTGVANTAAAIAARLDFTHQEQRVLRRAALLHDLGKLGVSNLILDKPGKLTDAEFAVMRRHTHHTAEILGRVSCFAPLVEDAASHHERLDGRGYHRGIGGERLSLSARILAVADICDALRSSRPYREGLPPERVLAIMDKEAGAALDPDCVNALRAVLTNAADQGAFHTPAAQLVSSLSEDYVQAA